MTPDEMDKMLDETLEDRRLSRSEKRALNEVVRGLATDPHQRALLQHRAFAVARQAINWYADRQVLDWLEDVVKVLRPFEPSPEATTADVYFSHRDDCSSEIVGLVSRAQRSVDICVFTITDDKISKAVLDAHTRKVVVRIITDDEKAHEPGSDVALFRQVGLEVRIDSSPHHMHHKFAIFDGRLLLTGSYNWTRGAARNNEENFLVTDDGRLVSAYAKEFEGLWEHYGKK